MRPRENRDAVRALAVKRLTVEASLPGDDQIGRGDGRVELGLGLRNRRRRRRVDDGGLGQGRIAGTGAEQQQQAECDAPEHGQINHGVCLSRC